MGLRIETFDNARGGNTLYKALTHPFAAAQGRALVAELRRAGKTAIVDCGGAASGFAEIYGLGGEDIAGVYVQDIARIGGKSLGCKALPVTKLAAAKCGAVLVAAFDAERLAEHLAPYLPPRVPVFSLDRMRLPDSRLTEPRNYLSPLNFATNFALFRDAGGLHTRLVTANYWSNYGGGAVRLFLTLFGGDGAVLADWCEEIGAGGRAIALDSRDIRTRFGLGEFAGQLFLHVAGAAGHDIVKYALDSFGDGALSCTHDANAWPAEFYAGLPAPAPGERVVLWVQNSHPTPIPGGTIGLAAMGSNEIARIAAPIGPFASLAVDAAALLPGLAWPRQIEIHAGKYVVRPRYEVVGERHRRLAHVNVERDDLRPNPDLPSLVATLGKGYLLPAPILPRGEWTSLVLPTPMARAQDELPLAALVYDADGREVARHRFGRLKRSHAALLDLDALAAPLGDGFGHVELIYDFAAGGDADGWLHALFRYRHRASGHAAETSFGAHVFNTIMTYRDEPQSYSGRPPGLSTRLFLRLGEGEFDTLCQLIYPASTPWRETSATALALHDAAGKEVARETLAIPCSGSRLWRYHETFDRAIRRRAGAGAYIVVRDPTCRLFGYHGLVAADGAFSLDHMFGF